MSTSPVDPAVKAASDWLDKELRRHARENREDRAILVYRMVCTFPLTIEQYWQVADLYRTTTNEAYLEIWLSSNVFERLTDWDGTGHSLLRLADSADALWLRSPTSLTKSHCMDVLRRRLAPIGPSVTWDSASFKKWYASLQNPLPVWELSDVRNLSKDVHADLLQTYIQRAVHEHFDLKVVQALVSGKRWQPEQIQSSISSYMSSSTKGKAPSQTVLVLKTWFDTLEWSLDTAPRHVSKLCELLKYDYHLKLWELIFPRLGKAMACLSDRPDVVLRLASEISSSVRSDGASSLKGLFLAAVDTELPEAMVLESIEHGGLLSVLANSRYSVGRRTQWLIDYKDLVLPCGDLPKYLKVLDAPLKGAVALWCFMEATSGGALRSPRGNRDVWSKSGITVSATSKRQFIETHVPALLDKIDIIQTLGLSYSAVLDMYLSSEAYLGAQEILALPEMAEG
jgi:hypothetical protein